MIIESPEALKEWLTNVLEPMCEADPTALAKYVIALVKKDKPIADIRETCIDQLDVFLQKETKPFVELLFKTLDNRSYLSGTDVPSTAVQQTPVSQVDPSPAVAAVSNNVVPNVISSIPTGASGAKLPERRTSHPDSVIDGEERDRENKQPGLIKGSTSSHNRSRSRSRSRNKSRSRSREREDRRSRRLHGEGERRRRGDGRRHDRYISYRRDRSRDRIDRDRERERDRERDRDRKRSRSRSMSRSKSRSKSRSRSRSKDKSRQRLDSQKLQNSSTGGQDHGDTDYRFGVPPPPALGSLAPSQNSSGIVTSIPPPSGSLDGQPPFPGRNARRCRDYDEKGFCMRGDLCPYDHGADPVVVEEAHLPSMLAYGSGNTNTPPQIPPGPGPGPRPPGPPPPGPIPPLLGPPLSHQRPLLPQPPLSLLQPPGSRLFPPMADPYIPEPYNPEAPAMDRLPPRVRPPFWGPRLGPGRGHGMRPPPQYPHPTRELINVPTVDNTSVTDNSSTNNSRTVVLPQKRPLDEPQGPPPPLRIFRNVDNTPANKVPLNRRPFDYNRLGNRKFNFENAVLELRKIPQGLNSITQLNNHFGRFGKIVNLQVCYEGDPEAALIQFSSHAEAHAAYRSTEAVLNNRFIKVFWHNKDGGLPAKSDNNVPVVKKLPAKERLGLPLTRSTSNEANSTTPEDVEKSSVTLATSGTLSKTVFNVAAMKKSNVSVNSQSVPTTPLKSHQAVAAKETIKKKQEEQRKEAMKINVDLQKRQQELIQKQIQQQKILIEKLEKNKNLSMAEKASIMTTLKMLQESIEKLKAELVASATLQASHPKTKQEAQKEILDIEMELYARQHQGGDTTELQKKVADLKQEALALGLIDSKFPSGRGRSAIRRVMRGAGSAFRGRGRGGGGDGSVRSVDHRPRSLQVTGFEESEKEEVMAHLSNYGDMENVDVDVSGSKLVVTYRNRREAEAAVQQGTKFKGRLLVMVWHQISGGLGANDGHDGLADGLTGEEELLEHETENEDLLLGDDDEEEDSEARSWRR